MTDPRGIHLSIHVRLEWHTPTTTIGTHGDILLVKVKVLKNILSRSRSCRSEIFQPFIYTPKKKHRRIFHHALIYVLTDLSIHFDQRLGSIRSEIDRWLWKGHVAVCIGMWWVDVDDCEEDTWQWNPRLWVRHVAYTWNIRTSHPTKTWRSGNEV